MKELNLRYGVNPQQKGAVVRAERLPFTVVNGSPGYNLLDALSSWQLVTELKAATGLVAAASFKHVSPAGVALGRPISDDFARAYNAGDTDLSSPVAQAFVRARMGDPTASYGDILSFSDPVDVPTAELIRREVSDGIIAPGYAPGAVGILQQKKGGKYLIVEMDPAYEFPETEQRTILGVEFTQQRNPYIPDMNDLGQVFPEGSVLPDSAKLDIVVAQLALKYTQSNSVAYTSDGQAIAIAPGQQSRIHCTRLATSKAENWMLRFHPVVQDLPFRDGLSRAERNTAIDVYLNKEKSEGDWDYLSMVISNTPRELDELGRSFWLEQWEGLVLASDGFFPFRDNIDRAALLGTRYVVHPGGSIRDAEIKAAIDEHDMIMVLTGTRLFHH